MTTRILWIIYNKKLKKYFVRNRMWGWETVEAIIYTPDISKAHFFNSRREVENFIQTDEKVIKVVINIQK